MAHTPLFYMLTRMLAQARRDNHKADGEAMPLPRRPTTRRQFLSGAIASSAGLAFGAGHARLSFAHRGADRAPRIAIVGGGIAGLNAAFQLKQQGLHATVYEARRRLGGRVQTIEGAVGSGLKVELGGEFINSDHEDMLSLAEHFGLKCFNRATDAQRFSFPATGYLFDGKAWSEADVAQQLRPLARQIAKDAALLDKDFDTYGPQFDTISVAAYLDQHADKIRAPFIRTLIEDSIRTELGVEAGNTSAIHLLFLLPTVKGKSVEVLGNSDELFIIEGGSGKLVEHLAGALAGQIHTNRVLRRIEERNTTYVLKFGDQQVVEADYVILAMPFAVLRHVDLAVTLPDDLRAFIGELDSGRNGKIIGGFRAKAWRQKSGFAAEAWTDLGFSSAWDATQRQADREDGALTLFLGGDEVQDADTGSAFTQGRALVRRLDAIVPGVAQAANGQFVRTRWHKDQFSRGSYVTFRPGQYTRFGQFLYIESDDPDERQDVHVGNLVFAGEHLSDAFYGYMNGAAETGRLAAAVVARQIAANQQQTSLNTANGNTPG